MCDLFSISSFSRKKDFTISYLLRRRDIYGGYFFSQALSFFFLEARDDVPFGVTLLLLPQKVFLRNFSQRKQFVNYNALERLKLRDDRQIIWKTFYEKKRNQHVT